MEVYVATGSLDPELLATKFELVEQPTSGDCPHCQQSIAYEEDSLAQVYNAGVELGTWLYNEAHGTFFDGVQDGMLEDNN